MLSCGNIGRMPEKNDGFLVNDVTGRLERAALKDFRDGQLIRYSSDMLPVSNGEGLDRGVNGGRKGSLVYFKVYIIVYMQ